MSETSAKSKSRSRSYFRPSVANRLAENRRLVLEAVERLKADDQHPSRDKVAGETGLTRKQVEPILDALAKEGVFVKRPCGGVGRSKSRGLNGRNEAEREEATQRALEIRQENSDRILVEAAVQRLLDRGLPIRASRVARRTELPIERVEKFLRELRGDSGGGGRRVFTIEPEPEPEPESEARTP